MPTLRVNAHDPDPEIIARGAAVIRRGGLVAFPTETVYGLGANALDEAAVTRIYEAKGRPDHNPLIVHVADAAAAAELVTEWPESAQRLARAFWPGPLTLVLPRSDRIPGRVSAGLPTVALRVPAHPVALALLRASGLPIVAPSANPSMAVSPTTAAHVERGLGDRVELILDGGPAGVGIESTVLDLTGGRPRLLRPGALSTEDLSPLVGEIQVAAGSAPEGTPRASPGMEARHYAPRGTVKLFGAGGVDGALIRVREASAAGRVVGALLLGPAGPGEGLDGEGRVDARPIQAAVHHAVVLPADPAGYARELYAVLHRLDDLGCDLILVETPPDTPAWAGIRDRLSRAAEPESAPGA